MSFLTVWVIQPVQELWKSKYIQNVCPMIQTRKLHAHSILIVMMYYRFIVVLKHKDYPIVRYTYCKLWSIFSYHKPISIINSINALPSICPNKCNYSFCSFLRFMWNLLFCWCPNMCVNRTSAYLIFVPVVTHCMAFTSQIKSIQIIYFIL